MDHQNQTQWLLDKLFEAKNTTALRKTKFVIDGGVKVCATMLKKVYHIDKNRLYKLFKKFKNGAVAPGIRNVRSKSDIHLAAIEWLEEYATHHGDRMPHNIQVLLPYRTRKYVIFKRYVNEKTARFEPSLGMSAFYKMWTVAFSHLRIKKVCFKNLTLTIIFTLLQNASYLGACCYSKQVMLHWNA